MVDRAALLSHVKPALERGFEVGALMSPFLPRSACNILVDRLSTAELKAFYVDEAAVPVERIVDVDVVVRDGDFVAALQSAGRPFDYAIASHVIEHIPNYVGWLSQIAELVRSGGRLILVVPDKRYTFDYLRRVSTLSEAIDAWVQNYRRPTPRQIFDYNAYAANVDKAKAWAGPLEPAGLQRYGTKPSALAMSVAAHRDRTYVDSHCWVFTPGSFLSLCADFADMGILRWKLVCFADTRRGEEDFGLVLERIGLQDTPATIGASFRDALPDERG